MARKGATIWGQLNQGWPEEMKQPSDEEALRGARMLYARFMGRPWTGPMRVARGRSHTWIRWDDREGMVFVVGPEYWHPRRGWPAIVHDLAHYIHRRKNPRLKPHSVWQAWLEREMQLFLLEQVLK